MTLLGPDASLPRNWGLQPVNFFQLLAEHVLPQGKAAHRLDLPFGKRLAITGGMYGAGTTWTFNILRNVALSRGQNVLGTYCENLVPAQIARLRRHDAMIVKSHVLGAASAELVRNGKAKLFLPIRDPRDAICSLMTRFNYSFGSALRSVAASADNILETQRKLPHLVLRYEDGFFSDVRSVTRICEYFGCAVARPEAQVLLENLRPDKVQSLIHKLEQDQAINPRWAKHSVDPQTNWHPNHVGDRRIGKYRDKLNPWQIDRANARLNRFINHYGYSPD